MKRIAALWLFLAPIASSAQPFYLSPPDLGAAMRRMDFLHRAAQASARADDRLPRLDQTVVLPQRPGQNQVAWYDFDWQYHDIPSPSGAGGGIRLYFYRRERGIAERALPIIRSAYLELVDRFHYTPTKQIPYFLYGSEREFQTTRLFPVSESVLGVTSPFDLKMSLPYFGKHELFREVSTHELVHQFTIQKLLDLAGNERANMAIEALPLWFIEGIAEYYAKGGLDPEADTYLRDLLWNPDPSRRYEMPPFAEDRLRGYIPTYKVGQARVAFIAEVYGEERIQGFLENSAVLGMNYGGERFALLLHRVLGESTEQVEARWREWLRQRYYPQYLRTGQDLPVVREALHLPLEPEAFAASPDGRVLFVRGIDRERGRAKLHLVDPLRPDDAVEIAADDRPGVESLHPLERNVLAIAEDKLAFTALSGPGDVLYVQPYAYRPAAPKVRPELSVGERRRLEVRAPEGRRFVEISDPTFSPDGRQIAFVGLVETGQFDIYVISTEGGQARRLTDDPYAERDLAWGRNGLLFASDATSDGRFALFQLADGVNGRTRLTTGSWNDGQPRPLPDGSVLFTSSASGKPDLYLLRGGRTRRISDFSTGLSAPAPSPGGRGIWAKTFNRGLFRIVELPRMAWLDSPALSVPTSALPPRPVTSEKIPEDAPSYSPYRLGNWRPEAAFLAGAGASTGVAGSGAILFADVLRDRLLYVELQVLGSFDLTQGLALYDDRAARTNHILGAYHFVQSQVDQIDTDLVFLQRTFGAMGALRFPLDRFRRVETELTVEGVQRYCLTSLYSDQIDLQCGTFTAEQQAESTGWLARNAGTSLRLGPTVRFGFDTVRYDPRAGPISGEAALVEFGGGWLPWRRSISGFARLDLVKYWPISGRMKFSLRASAGTSVAPDDRGTTWARVWWLASADNLRGYSPFDIEFLVARNFYVVNAELQVPLDPVLRLFVFQHLAGVVALDFGGAFNDWTRRAGVDPRDPAAIPADLGAWDVRTLTGVLGVNTLIGPIVLRVHFGHPFDIGGIRTPAQRAGTSWVTNITLRYFFF